MNSNILKVIFLFITIIFFSCYKDSESNCAKLGKILQGKWNAQNICKIYKDNNLYETSKYDIQRYNFDINYCSVRNFDLIIEECYFVEINCNSNSILFKQDTNCDSLLEFFPTEIIYDIEFISQDYVKLTQELEQIDSNGMRTKYVCGLYLVR